MAQIPGADVSGFQPGNLTFTDLAFVYVKATEGLVKVNFNHDAQVAAARAQGLVVGHYHFPAWGDPAAEARAFFAATGWRVGEFLVLDIESSTQTPWPTDPVSWCVAFENEVHRLSGLWCLDYAGLNVRTGWNWEPLAALGGGLVDPAYNPTGPGNPAPWKFVAMWQNTDAEPITHGDGDVFFGSAAALRSYGTPAGTVAPAPKPAPAPAPKPVPRPAPAAPSGTFKATVSSGDTMSSIAAQFGTTVDAILRVNTIRDPNRIYPGQVVNIPRGAAPTPAGPAACTVDPGDTLSSIGTQFGIPWQTIANLNHLAAPYTIYPGEALRLR